MLAELVAAGAALLVGGAMAAWQHSLSKRRKPDPPPELSARGPYRQGETPGAVVDAHTGGYPMPPAFDDDGWTPKA